LWRSFFMDNNNTQFVSGQHPDNFGAPESFEGYSHTSYNASHYDDPSMQVSSAPAYAEGTYDEGPYVEGAPAQGNYEENDSFEADALDESAFSQEDTFGQEDLAGAEVEPGMAYFPPPVIEPEVRPQPRVAPKYTAPQQVSPPQVTPQQVTPQQAVPQHEGGQNHYPQQHIPRQGVPQQRTPQQMPAPRHPARQLPSGAPHQGAPQQGEPYQGEQARPAGPPLRSVVAPTHPQQQKRSALPQGGQRPPLAQRAQQAAPAPVAKQRVRRSFFVDDTTAPASKVELDGETFYFDPLSDEAKTVYEDSVEQIAGLLGISVEEFLDKDVYLPQEQALISTAQANLNAYILDDALRNWTLERQCNPGNWAKLHGDLKRDIAEAIVSFSVYQVGEARFRGARGEGSRRR
jgi:hypothetical protein